MKVRLHTSLRHVQAAWSNKAVKAIVLGLTLLIMLLALPPSTRASANGDAVEIFRAREGPYEVVVGIQPEKPVVGTVHFSVTPLDASTSLPVTDAEIVIVANDKRGKPTYQARALNTPSSPQYYDANITFESAGAWTLLVSVRSQEVGEATFTVPLTVEGQSITPGLAGTFVFLALLAVLTGGALYVWHSARRRHRAARL